MKIYCPISKSSCPFRLQKCFLYLAKIRYTHLGSFPFRDKSLKAGIWPDLCPTACEQCVHRREQWQCLCPALLYFWILPEDKPCAFEQFLYFTPHLCFSHWVWYCGSTFVSNQWKSKECVLLGSPQEQITFTSVDKWKKLLCSVHWRLVVSQCLKIEFLLCSVVRLWSCCVTFFLGGGEIPISERFVTLTSGLMA